MDALPPTAIDLNLDLLSSSLALSEAAATQQTFEPILPSTTTLYGFGTVLLLSIVAGWVWANQVVPVSRTKLALSKKDGEMKAYLDELKAGDPARYGGLDDAQLDAAVEEFASSQTADGSAPADGRDFERWLFSDWLKNNKSASAGGGGRKKEPALPLLKNAKWNSGDNPVLVASALIGICVILASLTERVGQLL